MSSNGGKTTRYALAVLTVLLGMLVSAVPATGEINPYGESTWGVYGLKTGTQTDAIKSQVWAIEQIGNRIYVGGRFTETRKNKTSAPVAQPFLAAFDANSGAWISSFRPSLDGAVYALEASPDGSKLFVGGEFKKINGDSEARGLAALNPANGSVDTSWRGKVTNSGGARGIVYSLEAKGPWLYAGGRFDTAGGGPRIIHTTVGAARMRLTDGQVDRNFTVRATGGAVWGIAVSPDQTKIYLAGRHTAVDGNTAGGYYSVLSSVDGKLIPSLSTYVGNASRQYGQDVVAVGNLVFWGGSEHVVNVYNATTGKLVRKHSTDIGGDFQDFEVVGDRVYASCHCYTNHWADFDYWAAGRPKPADAPAGVKVTPIKYVSAYSANTGAHIPSFKLNVSASQAGVWAIHGSADGCLWVGGDLTRVTMAAGNDRALGGFAKFCDSVDTAAPTKPGNLTQTRQENKKIVLKWNASSDNAAVTRYQVRRNGQNVGTKTHTSAKSFWFIDKNLTPGTTYTYQVIAEDAVGNQSQVASVSASTSGGGAVITAPTGLRSTLQTRERIVLNWAKTPGAASYVIERNSGAGFTPIATQPSRWFTNKALPANAAYQYRVRAVTANGQTSAPSATISVRTKP